MCIYTHVYLYIYINKYIYICIYTYLYIHAYVYIYKSSTCIIERQQKWYCGDSTKTYD